MPQLDPAALKTLRTEAARNRAALDNNDAKVAEAATRVRAAQAALETARRSGNNRAAQSAETTLAAGRAALEAARGQRTEINDRLREALDRLRDADFEAPGEHPLLLLPIRIETRFESARRLKIRIYPDTIHVDGLDRGLTPEEEQAGRSYWTALWQGGDAAAETAWPILLQAVGEARATWSARATTPTNLPDRDTGGAPEFPKTTAARRSSAVAQLLPEVFHVTAVQQGQVTRGRGKQVAPEIRIGLIADDGSELVDKNGLKMLEGTEWLADYDVALASGMAITLDLPKATAIDRLFVYGVSRSRDAAAGARGLTDLFEAHWCTAGLAFAPQGTPTNNIEEESSGWQRRIEPRSLPLGVTALDPEANGSVLGQALGIDAPWLALLDHAGAREQAAAQAMNGALWPATWGYFLETLDDASEAISPVTIDAARAFHAARVRGRGPLPAIRVGEQPYGVLPVTPLRPGRDAPSFERDVMAFLGTILPDWKNGVPGVPRIGKGGDAAEILLDILGWSPVSFGARARKCLSGNMIQAIGATTSTASDAIAIEAMLGQLLAETLGRFSFAHSIGTLEPDSRPILLPYADPARDGAFLADILTSGKVGTISSIFQALVAVGWERVREAAKPPSNFNFVAELATNVEATLLRDAVGAVNRASDTNPTVFSDLLARLPGAGDPAARPAARKVQPLATNAVAGGRFLDFALDATSQVERVELGLFALDDALRMSNRLGEMRAALQKLTDLVATPVGADFTLLVAETLDSASHRLDAWITAMASSRLARQRAARPAGLTIGAFGWLEDVAPQDRAKRRGGYIAAPSLAQATTAGLLRSAYLTHNPDGAGSSAFAIDLSSARVRLALSLLDGVRNGQPIGALLGYGFERRLHDIDADRFILTFRGLAPLVQGALTDGGESPTPEAQQAIAAANVTDMLKLIDRYRAPNGPAAIRTALEQRPADNEYLDANTPWDKPSAALWTSIQRAIEESMEEADAVADLMLAEAVHQLAQGNLHRASATLDAAGRGEGPPTEPDFVVISTPGVIVTHRLVVIAPSTGAWSTATPRAAAAPGVEAWLGTRLGPPKRIVLSLESRNRRITMAESGVSALDFTLDAADPIRLERNLRARLGLAPGAALTAPGDAGLRADEITLAEAIHAARALAAVLEQARALDAFSLALPGQAAWRPAPAETATRLATLGSLLGLLGARVATLDALLAEAEIASDSLGQAMRDLAEFGVVVPDLGDPPRAELAFLALDEARSRLGNAEAIWAKPSRSQEALETFGEALFGRGFVLPTPLSYQPEAPTDPTGERAVNPVAPGAIERFLADAGAIHPATGAFNKASLLASLVGGPPRIALLQLCGHGDRPIDDWIGAGLPPEAPTPDAPVVAILADAPEGIDLGKVVEGLILDDWTETMAPRYAHGENAPVTEAGVTAGVAIHADAPNAQPPQSLLLALAPGGENWTEDSLVALLDETLDLAKVRLITLDSLPLAGRILPAIYTDSWSLQGERRLDWSKIAISMAELNATTHLRNFTLTKEA